MAAIKLAPQTNIDFSMDLTTEGIPSFISVPNRPEVLLRRGLFMMTTLNHPVFLALSTTSGQPNAQDEADQSLKDLGLIPSCKKSKVQYYYVQTESIYQPATKGVNGDSYFITSPNNPDGYFYPDGIKRDGFLIHLDSNFLSSPGSAGCIVFTNPIEWNLFRLLMKGVNKLGYTHIKLNVRYRTQ